MPDISGGLHAESVSAGQLKLKLVQAMVSCDAQHRRHLGRAARANTSTGYGVLCSPCRGHSRGAAGAETKYRPGGPVILYKGVPWLDSWNQGE